MQTARARHRRALRDHAVGLLLAAILAAAGMATAMAASAIAGAGQPIASISLAKAGHVLNLDIHRRMEARSALKKCERRHPGRCGQEHRALERSSKRLARAHSTMASLRRGSKSVHANGRRAGAGEASISPSPQAPDQTTSATASSALQTTSFDAHVRSKEAPSGTTPIQESLLPSSPVQEALAPSPPVEESLKSSATFQPGINSGWDMTYDVPGAAQLGAKLVRLAVGIEQTPAQLEPIVAAYAAHGIRVLPMASFYGSMPTPAEAKNLASWASTFGPGGSFWAGRSDGQLAIQSIEFGNETSYSYQYSEDSPAGYAARAQAYAQRFAEAAIAIRSVNQGVGLLAQGDAGNAGSSWIENMFKAVPDLGTLVAGWTIHPYGTGWRPRLENLIAETAAQGAPSNIPIDITEWGLSSDNGQCLSENYGWNACMTYQEAAEALSKTVSEMRGLLGDRLGMFMLYQIRDQQTPGSTTNREAYFGALQHELQPKGAYTSAVESLLAS